MSCVLNFLRAEYAGHNAFGVEGIAADLPECVKAYPVVKVYVLLQASEICGVPEATIVHAAVDAGAIPSITGQVGKKLHILQKIDVVAVPHVVINIIHVQAGNNVHKGVANPTKEGCPSTIHASSLPSCI